MNLETKPFDYARYQSIMNSAFPCPHERREKRRKTDSRGRIRVREQCPDCGRATSGELKREVLNGKNPADLPPWDFAKEAAFWESYHAVSIVAHDEIDRDRQASWWAQYAIYLASPEWRELRIRVMQRHGGMCAVCRKRTAAQAHHQTYERVGHEDANDLVPVCMECHRELHPQRFSVPQ